MIINKFAIFITNSDDKSRGSSLYLILSYGTIRVSGANDVVRKATTFIRPYTIGYYKPQDPKQLCDTPQIGLFPLEAEVNTINELVTNSTVNKHHGHAISEIVTTEDLVNESFQPKTWIGANKNGTEWNVARKALIDTMLHVNKTKSCTKAEKLIPVPEVAVAENNQRISM